MPATIRVSNYDPINIKERSVLDADAAAAATALVVQTNQNIVADDYLLVGTQGSESSEIVRVQSTSGARSVTLVAPGLTIPHARFATITILNANQVRLYRAANVDGTTPADASFAVLATKNIDPDQLNTDFSDAGGGSGYWYKFTYRHEVSTAETSLAAANAARGAGYGGYCSVFDIRGEAGLVNNTYIKDGTFDDARREAQAEIDGALYGIYVVPFTPPINSLIAKITKLIAAGLVLTSDFGPMNTGTNKNGKAKLDEGRALLERIKSGELKLTDVQGVDTSSSTARASVWPNNSTATADADVGGGTRKFRVSDRY